jgi:hypothetical protein
MLCAPSLFLCTAIERLLFVCAQAKQALASNAADRLTNAWTLYRVVEPELIRVWAKYPEDVLQSQADRKLLLSRAASARVAPSASASSPRA